MVHSIKFIGREASTTTLYRNLLKACARHPDPYVGEWYACRWRGNFKLWLSQSLAPDEIVHKMRRARRTLLRLQRAASGEKTAFDYTVLRAYGGVGQGRWPLLSPFIHESVLPPKISILRDRPSRTLPTYSPLLVSLADSPLILDSPRPPLRLAFPETLPPHGIPANPELINRQFLEPSRETNIRKRYYNSLLDRIKIPLVVRVVGVQKEEKGGGMGDLYQTMRELGIKWGPFRYGRREELLDRLERWAGKEDASSDELEKKETPRRRRTPIDQLDPSLPPQPPFLPPTPSSSVIPPKSRCPPFPSPQTIHHSSLAPPLLPAGYQEIYRHLLSLFPIVTVDLSRIEAQGEWLVIQFSDYATDGPAFFHPADEVEDLPFLVDASASALSVEASDESLLDFPPFVYTHPLKVDLKEVARPEQKLKVAIVRRKLKQAAIAAEVERRRDVVRERLTKRGLSEEEVLWTMEGKWAEREKNQATAVEMSQEELDAVMRWERELKRSRERKERRAKERARVGLDI